MRTGNSGAYREERPALILMFLRTSEYVAVVVPGEGEGLGDVARALAQECYSGVLENIRASHDESPAMRVDRCIPGIAAGPYSDVLENIRIRGGRGADESARLGDFAGALAQGCYSYVLENIRTWRMVVLPNEFSARPTHAVPTSVAGTRQRRRFPPVLPALPVMLSLTQKRRSVG